MAIATHLKRADVAAAPHVKRAGWLVGCGDTADCLSDSYIATMAGIMSVTCTGQASLGSLCSFACGFGYSSLGYASTPATGSAYNIARTCFNMNLPSVCTTASLGEVTGSTCSTRSGSEDFPTATYGRQHCPETATISDLGGDASCKAICPMSYSLTVASSTAFCTTVTAAPSSSSSQAASDAKSQAAPASSASILSSAALTSKPPTSSSSSSSSSRSTVNVTLDGSAGRAPSLKPSRLLCVILLLLMYIA